MNCFCFYSLIILAIYYLCLWKWVLDLTLYAECLSFSYLTVFFCLIQLQVLRIKSVKFLSYSFAFICIAIFQAELALLWSGFTCVRQDCWHSSSWFRNSRALFPYSRFIGLYWCNLTFSDGLWAICRGSWHWYWIALQRSYHKRFFSQCTTFLFGVLALKIVGRNPSKTACSTWADLSSETTDPYRKFWRFLDSSCPRNLFGCGEAHTGISETYM